MITYCDCTNDRCMMCCTHATPDELGILACEEDDAGNWWVYCNKCDCWTEHPPLIDR